MDWNRLLTNPMIVVAGGLVIGVLVVGIAKLLYDIIERLFTGNNGDFREQTENASEMIVSVVNLCLAAAILWAILYAIY